MKQAPRPPKAEPASRYELSASLAAIVYRRGAVDFLRSDRRFHVNDLEMAKLIAAMQAK